MSADTGRDRRPLLGGDDVAKVFDLGLGVQDAAAAWAIVERVGRLGEGRRGSL